jgi:putative ABC transport system permease protein
MLKYYLKSAIRNLTRHKLYTIINVSGLTVGLAACLLIVGYVNNELSFENCHRYVDRIYRVECRYGQGSSQFLTTKIMPAVGPAIKQDFPEVEHAVRIRDLWTVPIEWTDDGISEEREVLAAEPDLLNIFTLPLKEGNPQTALEAPFSVIISQELARLHFGEQNALGKTIRARDEFDLQITGVFERIPANTRMRTDLLVSYSTLDRMGMDTRSWTGVFRDVTYLLLQTDADPTKVEGKIPWFLQQHLGEEDAGDYSLQLQPLDKIYLHPDLSKGPLYIYIFSFIAFLILLIASINFVNLSTALVSHRVREVGIRKVLGALRPQLVKQFLSESVLLTVTAMLFGIALFEMAKPLLESFIGRQLEIDLPGDPGLLLSVLGMIVFVGVLSGSYPAFVLARSQPSFTLRGEVFGVRSKSLLRRILVVFQFVIAVVLLCVTFSVYRQIHYAVTTDLGFDPENVLLIDAEEGISPEKQDLIKNQILGSGLVSSVTVTDCAPGESRVYHYGVRPENKLDSEPVFFHGMRVDSDYLSTFGMELMEGRNFSAESAADVSGSVLINQAAVKQLETSQPIGSKLYIRDKVCQVVGVVRDFHSHSFHMQIMPMALFAAASERRLIAVKLPPDYTSQTIAEVEKIWNRIVPGASFEYSFLEDAVGKNYHDDRKLGALFGIFSLLTVFLACLGLFALAAFNAERRTKEIGIRKTLGASVAGILGLLCKEMVVLVAIANTIAWPVAYLVINRWLETFAYRTQITVTWFLLSGIMVLFIALAAIGYQSVKAALANPVDSLRYE